MRKLINRTIWLTGGLALLWLGYVIADERKGMELTESILMPWLEICRDLTPENWQKQGNIILGMVWFFSGVVVCSVIAALTGAFLLALAEYWWKRRQRTA